MEDRKFKQYFATVLVVLLSIFLIFVVYKFINGFFGAVLLYIILLPLYNFLIKHKFGKKNSALILVFIALFVIIGPLLFLLIVIANQLVGLLQNPELLAKLMLVSKDLFAKLMPFVGDNFLAEQVKNLTGFFAGLVIDVISNIGLFLMNLFIALFLLYFMLTNGHLIQKLEKILPFNKKNAHALVEKIKDVSFSTVIVGGVIALVQGGLLTISFLIFGISNAFLWGSFAAILSFFPIIGPPIIWVPVTIIQIVQGNYVAGIGIFIFGLFLSNIDNFLRPYLGNKISRIHPLITLIGIFAGVALFGLIGLFLGPLLLALSIQVLKMFKEEYVK